MRFAESQGVRSTERWGLLGAIGAAVAASICCLGPLALLALGVGGAWVGNLTALGRYRPVFIVVTVGSLGFAFYRAYRKESDGETCKPGSYCANPARQRINKVVLWFVSALVVGLLAFPYVVPYLPFGGGAGDAGASIQTSRAVLDVRNMTCPSCVVTVRGSLSQLDGVQDAVVTREPPRAVVTYDRRRVSIGDLVEATTNAGYPSSVKAEGGV